MRVAIVHDWLYVLGGAERVLRELLRCYPQAQVFALFDVLTPEQRAWIGYERAETSFLQRMPRIEKLHRSLLPLLPFAIEQLDVSGYDLVISSSSAVAKGVITGPHQVHISYVHSPMRYAWDLQERYLAESPWPFASQGSSCSNSAASNPDVGQRFRLKAGCDRRKLRIHCSTDPQGIRSGG